MLNLTTLTLTYSRMKFAKLNLQFFGRELLEINNFFNFSLILDYFGIIDLAILTDGGGFMEIDTES